MGSRSTDFCHGLFKNLKVLPLQFQYVFYVVKNRELFRSNSDEQNINKTCNYNLHLPIANLTVFQREFIILE
jgi:hypothetical protein